MKKTVLVIEDDKDIQEYYEVVFSEFQLNLLKAYNGRDALKLIDSGETVDLIILDIVMPVMDGEEFLRILREERNLDIPVIVCSVDEISASRLHASLPVQGVFFKLGLIDDLLNMVRDHLNLA